MNHVAALVGGMDSQQKRGGQEGVIFTPVSRERQTAAVKFLIEHAFKVPAFACSRKCFGAWNQRVCWHA
jgi:cobyrinic acid a,c-diamide synthase